MYEIIRTSTEKIHAGAFATKEEATQKLTKKKVDFDCLYKNAEIVEFTSESIEKRLLALTTELYQLVLDTDHIPTDMITDRVLENYDTMRIMSEWIGKNLSK